jgi:sulfite exporter TauE/SafE
MAPAELATPLGAFLFGVLGSAHCVAMCGGIAAALALRAPDPRHAFLHSSGRVLGYAIAGALVAGAVAAGSRGLALSFDPRPIALALRLTTAALFIALGARLLLERPPWRALEAVGARVWNGLLAPIAQRAGRREGRLGALMLGVLWGWLPCGMSWTALFAAATTGSALGGATTMLAFGAGTLPALGVGAWLIGGRTDLLRRPGWRRWSGALLIGLGLWSAWGAFAAGGHAHHH